ncbi:cobalt-zinc-cadmium resistance protein [Vibrio sp. 10N.286.49.B3]|uniref:cation transporter n=1 Tax=Vibrio sp. 10N.286.49.B3 TaxID=1880855 RepID=UPI000C83A286|nr:cation transporter [Vibrio sp. 10N.286.49.B3]PMH46650.1 cobalt-zinc-cadmium resistance protein [Vibrio sp. 10N.286.49.B3]
MHSSNLQSNKKNSTHIQKEQQLLLFSTLFALFFALLGIGLGWWMGSLVILFDGVYSLVSLALTLVSLMAATFINHPKNNSNSAFIEHAVIAFKGFIITLMCLFSFYSALATLLSGGHEVDADLAIVFAVVNVIGCVVSYRIMKQGAKAIRSSLVDAEAKQWMMDAIISGAVLVGFFIAKVLSLTSLSAYAAYADPMMVIIASLYFVIIPIKMTLNASKELYRNQFSQL